MSATMSRIDAAGRLLVPAQTRKALSLEGGGPVVLSVVDGELRVRSVAGAMAALQTQAAAYLGGEGASVDAFLTARRTEAAREAMPVANEKEEGEGSDALGGHEGTAEDTGEATARDA